MAKNKLQKFAEMAEYDHVFQADFSDLYSSDNDLSEANSESILGSIKFHMRGKWCSEFFHNDNPIVVELGCGKGEYTVGLAKLYPDKNFIGVDIKGARMHTGATQAKEEGLTNVAFIRTRIEFIEAFFAQDEVSEIWVTFPDPQMKKERKRLVGTLMLSRYRNFLKKDGFVHLKTDSPFLYTYTSEMLNVNNIKPEVALADLYGSGYDDKILSIKTYYEGKWLEHGLTIKYLKFNLPQLVKLVEPDIEIEHDTYHMVGRGVQEKKKN